MRKINYVIISGDDYLRELAKKTMLEDYEKYQSLTLDQKEYELENFQFRIGNVLELDGERLVCDLFEDEEYNKVSGTNIWGYIVHMYNSGSIYVELFFLGSARYAVEDLAVNILNTVSFDFDNSGSNCNMLGEMQLIIEFDDEKNTWIGLDEVKLFLQEFPRTVKSCDATKKVLNKYILRNDD
jgi:hypothetical protein